MDTNVKSRRRLLLMKTYLCGAMDRVADGGVTWRREIKPWLDSRGIIVFDPASKPLDETTGDETDRATRLKWMEQGEYDKVRDFMKVVRGYDLRMVNESNFIIMVIDPSVHLCGSYEEMAIANHEKKPILVYTIGGKDKTPWWVFSMIPHEEVFGSMEELLAYLDHIDSSDEIETHGRWYFFDRKKMYTPAILEMIRDGV